MATSFSEVAIFVLAGALILKLAAWSPSAGAVALLFASLGLVIPLLIARRAPAENLWDRSMLATAGDSRGWRSLWLWWGALAAVLLAIYIWLW
ncbi:MAG: hypothetical protein HY717_17670 [Planctomycetes bacterium]|nr:hypothetical protein [Planctomycetota bacterium]